MKCWALPTVFLCLTRSCYEDMQSGLSRAVQQSILVDSCPQAVTPGLHCHRQVSLFEQTKEYEQWRCQETPWQPIWFFLRRSGRMDKKCLQLLQVPVEQLMCIVFQLLMEDSLQCIDTDLWVGWSNYVGGWVGWAIPENKDMKRMKFSFFHQRHALSTSFDIFVVTYRVTNFLPKLMDMLLFFGEKTEFPFFEIPYFRVLRVGWYCGGGHRVWPETLPFARIVSKQCIFCTQCTRCGSDETTRVSPHVLFWWPAGSCDLRQLPTDLSRTPVCLKSELHRRVGKHPTAPSFGQSWVFCVDVFSHKNTNQESKPDKFTHLACMQNGSWSNIDFAFIRQSNSWIRARVLIHLPRTYV